MKERHRWPSEQIEEQQQLQSEVCSMAGHSIEGRYEWQRLEVDADIKLWLFISLIFVPALVITLPLYLVHAFKRKHLYDICSRCGGKWYE